MNGRPPVLARWLLRILPLRLDRSEIEDDLLDLFKRRARARGRRYARWRYYHDVLSLWRKPVMTMPSLGKLRALSSLRHEIVGDLAYAARLLRQSPGVVAVAVSGLAIAIAVSTSVFTVLKGVAFRSTGVDDPSSAVSVWQAFTHGVSTAWSYSQYVELREHAEQLALEAVLPDSAYFAETPGGAANESIAIRFVSGGYLGAMTNRVSTGRLLHAFDDRPGADPVVVLNHKFWSHRLASDPAIVGRPIWLNGARFTVVGVAAKRFTGTRDSPPALWAPIGSYNAAFGGAPMDRTASTLVSVVGRVKPGISLEQAQMAVGALGASLNRHRADSSRNPVAGVALTPLDGPLSARQRTTTSIVTGIVFTIIALLMLLACVNVANLLLASALSRRLEISVRLALGASRSRIVRQLLTESVSLGVAGGALGLLVTYWLVPILLAFVNAPAMLDATPDTSVYLFLASVSTLAGFGSGLAAAMPVIREHSDSSGTSGALLKGSVERRAPRRRLRTILVGAQAAASIVLLMTAALLARALIRSTQVDVGFDADRLLVVEASFGRGAYDATRAKAYWDVSLERVRALPGVVSASLAEYPPFVNASQTSTFNRAGGRYVIYHNATQADYFGTLGLRAVRGRTYTAEDVAQRAPVAVISKALAHDFFPGEDPVGQRLDRIQSRSPRLIIGVVPNVITARLRELGGAAIYTPIADLLSAKLLIRSDGPPERLMPSIRGALQPLDPSVRLDVRAVSDGLRHELAEPRILASLAATLAAIALGLSVVGLYGLTAFIAGQRRQEIGVRMALGATTQNIRWLLLYDGLRPVIAGLGVGIVAALLGSRVFSGVLYGVGPADPIAFAGAVGVLVAAAAAAVAVPARHAARVDPATLLRME